VNHGYPEGSFHLSHRLSDRLAQIAVEIQRDQVRQDLRVGFGPKPNALLLESFLEAMKIFDDPIVDDEDLLILITVGVGVLLRRFAMRRPSGVGNADTSREFQAIDLPLEFDDLAHSLVTIYGMAVLNGEAR
jgi:hypothetical protein